MLPGKRDFYLCCSARRSATYTVLAAISKLRSAFFMGYKNKICTYYIYIYIIYIYIRDSQLNRPESVSLASLARQLFHNDKV